MTHPALHRITSSALLLLFVPATLICQLSPKRLYLAPDDHTDYYWTADSATYRQAFLNMIDFYLDRVDSTAGLPPEYQSRWNCDGSFWLWTYEHEKSPAEFGRLMNRILDGHFSTPLTALVSCYGGTPAEAVLRGMYYAGSLERRYHTRFSLAVAMENQTLPYGLAALWAGAGAKYSWRGICACASKVPFPGDREYDLYWWMGPDSSRILMKWNSFFGNQSLGGYAEAYDPEVAAGLLSEYCYSPQYPYGIAGAFGRGWDALQTYTTQFPEVAMDSSNASRQYYVSNEEDFFRDVDSTYGAALPHVAASFGNEWELYAASMAEVTASVRRAVESLRGAEGLATLVSLKNPGFMSGREDARANAWMNLGLYWEHDWTGDGPVGRSARAAWQRRMASGVVSYVASLGSDAAYELSGMIQRSGSVTRFFVFNPLGWERTDIADVAYRPSGPVHVVDLFTGLEVPSQTIVSGADTLLRILAPAIPSVGYKVFEVVPGAGTSFTPSAGVTGNVLENDLFRITLASNGAISGIIDKSRGGRELVQNIGGRVMNDIGPGSAAFTAENIGPVSATLVATITGSPARTSRYTLIRGSSRIDIRNEITENFGDVKTWTFSCNIAPPDVRYEEVGGILLARLRSQGGDYSDRSSNTRYDWQSLNHFADISNGGQGVTISNIDCSFMKVGASTVSTLDIATPQISILAGGQVDGTSLGIQDQDGDSYFLQRFAVESHDAFDPVHAMRFALEHQTPFRTDTLRGGQEYPADRFSLVSVSDSSAILWALKPADDGIQNGVVARLWNCSNAALTTHVAFAPSIASAVQTTHLETDITPASLTDGVLDASFGARQMLTFRIIPSLIDTVPGVPSLLLPPDGATGVSTSPRISWGPVIGADAYRIELAADSGMTRLVLTDSTVPAAYDLTALAEDSVYFWRVAASNAFGVGGWSDVWSFRVAAGTTVGVGVRKGWNMISLPLKMQNTAATVLFPTATSSLFSYGAILGYLATDTLAAGEGYWIKFGEADTISLTGEIVLEESVSVREGWNLVGAISDTVQVSAVTVVPVSVTVSKFFGYANGYFTAGVLHPGNGYWVKSSGDAIVIIRSAGTETRTHTGARRR